MGYDLHITRAIDWTANRGLEISSDEWLAIVDDDADLSLDPPNGPLSVRFGPARWLDWFEGNVFSTDPDFATVAKMLDIAERLAGAVQGDDGEFYDSASQWSQRRASGAEEQRQR